MLNAGDLFPADPSTAHLYINGLIGFSHRIGLDALGIGDQELALGKPAWDDLKKRVRFPLILSNLIGPEGKPYFSPNTVVKRGGIRIGIISLISEPRFSRRAAASFPGFRVRDPADTARELVNELRPRSDLVVLLSHLGMRQDQKLARSVQGIDFIFGAHPGTLTRTPVQVERTLIMQTLPQGKYLGRLDLVLTGGPPFSPRLWTRLASPSSSPEKGSGVIWYNNLPVPMDHRVKEDPEVQKLVKKIKASLRIRNRPAPRR